MKSNGHRIRRSMALAIVVGALAAPVASAAPAEQLIPTGDQQRGEAYAGSVSTPPQSSPSPATPPSPSTASTGVTPESARPRGDVALAAIAAGAVVVVGHRPRRGHTVA